MGGQVFSTELTEQKHPIMNGFGGFSSWDETYIHTKHNTKNRTVLEYRAQGEQSSGNKREPWTWIRTHGKGRIFYTAWGHDQRTWSNPGFHNLVERGIRWACGSDPKLAGAFKEPGRFDVPVMTKRPKDLKPFEYVDVGPKIPNYPKSRQWGKQEKPLTLMQKPLPPAESKKHFVTPEGFEVKLFASEPDLGGKPISMNWDLHGRLWVCETYDYPNELQPPGKGRDRIRICEDTTGDGRADKFTLFADKLSIPTAILPVRAGRGAIVQDGRETLFLLDSDGDGRADIRRTLISNWSLGDTHGGVSNFRYGLDNWVWAMQGYNNSRPILHRRDGSKTEIEAFRMGFFRFKLSDHPEDPEVSDLEFVRSTNNNTWGLGIGETGLIFGSTANHNPSVFMGIPNRYYERVRGWSPSPTGTIADTHMFKPVTEKVRQVDQHGGYTAGAGHALYTARNYPKQYWNSTAFVCGPTGHLVGTFVLKPDGAGFKSNSPCNLLASHDEWSAPIMAEVGPDGNVWVLDWYNYIVQHNPTPQGFKNGKGNAYATDLRDKKHGRIYRVVYSPSAGKNPPPTVTLGKDWFKKDAVAVLKHPTMLWRLLAQQYIVENKAADASDLVALLADETMDDIGLNVGAIHALHTLHGLGDASAALTTDNLASPGVRRALLSALPRTNKSGEWIVNRQPFLDPDPQVRVAALLAMSEMPPNIKYGREPREVPRSLGSCLASLAMNNDDYLRDRWVFEALTTAAAAHGREFLITHAEAGLFRVKDRGREVIRIVAEHIARSPENSETMQAILVKLPAADPSVVQPIVTGFVAGWPKDASLALNSAAESALVKTLQKVPAGTKSQLVRLGSVWGTSALDSEIATVVQSLMKALDNEKADLKQRLTAAQQLIAFRAQDNAVVADVLEYVTPQQDPEFALGLLDTVGSSTADKTGLQLTDLAASTTPRLRDKAISILLQRTSTTRDLLAAISDRKISLNDLSLDRKQALNNHPDKNVQTEARRLLSMSGGLPNPDRDRVLKEKLALADQAGDIDAGRAMFKKHCAKCHKHGDLGENIGPNLTGMAVHPKAELLTHILDPGRSVEGNFRIYTVVMDSGRVFNGMLSSESRTSIELIDAEAKRHALQRSEIDELIASRKSLMPEGFEKQMNDAELSNLLEFLTDKGPFLPIDFRKVASITSARGMFFEKSGTFERLLFPDWKPKTFDGVPFVLIDPEDGRINNTILLHSTNGKIPRTMPREVSLPINTPLKSIHMLSGISGWGHPLGQRGSVSVIVRLHYADGKTEDHTLKNGIHFADYVRRIDVPESKYAFNLGGKQLRFLSVNPQRDAEIEKMSLIKGPDSTAPIIMAITAETR